MASLHAESTRVMLKTVETQLLARQDRKVRVAATYNLLTDQAWLMCPKWTGQE